VRTQARSGERQAPEALVDERTAWGISAEPDSPGVGWGFSGLPQGLLARWALRK
jgi:hypothetical protein